MKRTAGKAYDDGIGYTSNLQMDGDSWTTLCPAPLANNAVYPDLTVTERRKGSGCILLDTVLDNSPLASDAVVKTSGGASVFDFHWLSDDTGHSFGIGFSFDKTLDNSLVTMNAISDKIRNEGIGPRQMDGDRKQPNTDDKQWTF